MGLILAVSAKLAPKKSAPGQSFVVFHLLLFSFQRPNQGFCLGAAES
jgi:hypothetical protein